MFISKGVHTSNQVFISKEEQEEEEEGLFKADACSLVSVYTQIIRCSK